MNSYKNLLNQKKKLNNNIKFFYKNVSKEKLNFNKLKKIHSKKFSLNDNIFFSNVSGDKNPIHIDKIFARKTIFGQPIVHGCHLLIYALNIVYKKNKIIGKKFQVNFLKPVFTNQLLTFYINELEDTILIANKEIIFVKINIEKNQPIPHTNSDYKKNLRKSKPKKLSIKLIKKNKTYKFVHACEIKKARNKFPYLYQAYGSLTASELFDLSYLVGMECPGKHSLFLEANIELKYQNINPNYKISKYDYRFKLLNISTKTKNMSVEIKAFIRPAPVVFPNIKELKKIVKNKEFKSIKALIIGGSRGLGSLTAKLIAAGGGEVIITYNDGRNEALKLIKEIKEFGSKGRIIQYNIQEEKIMKTFKTKINQCYYYATPRIFGKQKKNFDKLMFKKFLLYYVIKFEKIIKNINKNYKNCSFFFPSTISISEPLEEIIEYTNAKLEAEIMITKLTNQLRDKVLIERYPRLLTDQTNTILNINTIDSSKLVVKTIRNLIKL